MQTYTTTPGTHDKCAVRRPVETYNALLELQAPPIEAVGLEQAEEALEGIEWISQVVQHGF